MVHVFVVSELVDHRFLNLSKRQPPSLHILQDKLDAFAMVMVAAPELAVRFVFVEGHDDEVVILHYRVHDCGDALEEVAGDGFIGTGERSDKVDVFVWRTGLFVED
jgi:hypothetical protein